MKRKIGLDVGDKTVGIAVSDPLGITAQGVTTLERIGIKRDTTAVLEYIQKYDCDTVVVGLPLSLSGEDSEQTAKVREFRTKLENKLRSKGLQDVNFEWQDERLTSVQAERVMINADLSRNKRKEIIDRQAAVIILQTYLDRQGK